MTIQLASPGVDELPAVAMALRDWQREHASFQLHPGDIGWFWRFGADATAAAVRTWTRDGAILAVGMLDGANLLRLTTAPVADAELTEHIARDIADPARGVLPGGQVFVEAPNGSLVRRALADRGWELDASWTPLSRDLADPVPDPGLRIEVVGPPQVAVRAALQRAAFENSTFTDERWHAMAAGPEYHDARCLIGWDDAGNPVATITVWSAGPGRPGLIEPMGVSSAFRGRGHGRAITLAGAAALRELGSSSATVCTESSNVAAVATYRSAGLEPRPERRDLARGRL